MITMQPEEMLNEASNINKKITEGFSNLVDVGEIGSGVTPHDTIYEEDKLKLFHYKSDTNEQKNPVPLLIVYALVNRPYMADIQENRSTIKGLMDNGQDVYLIDWGYADEADQYLTMDDYINGYIDRCVDILRERHNEEKINLLGICQGGTFSLCYSSMHPEKVRNLVTMVTPVDFHTPDNMLSHWVQNIDIDLLVDTQGNISGDLLNGTFLSMKPYELMGQKYIGVIDILDSPDALKNFMRMEQWIFDSPDQAAETFRQFVKDFYQGNKLISGDVVIGDKTVDLKNLTMPILNIYAEQDHLVPPAATTPLKEYVGSNDYNEISFPGGHIGIYVSGRAQKTVPPEIGAWLSLR